MSSCFYSEVRGEQHSLVVDEEVHEQALLDEAPPLGVLSLEVAVRVVGHDDARRLVRQLDDEAVVVADHAPALHASRRCEHQQLLLLQPPQDLLVWGEGTTLSTELEALSDVTHGEGAGVDSMYRVTCLYRGTVGVRQYV